jgi:hypothetical protein
MAAQTNKQGVSYQTPAGHELLHLWLRYRGALRWIVHLSSGHATNQHQAQSKFLVVLLSLQLRTRTSHSHMKSQGDQKNGHEATWHVVTPAPAHGDGVRVEDDAVGK